jgi:PadR family transcriptional regulator, regulatory protein PadR
MARNRVSSKISRGSTELVILALLGEGSFYGFEIAKSIEERSDGALCFTLASLYPMLYELERRGWIKGQWKSNQEGRDRRYYSLTATGKKALDPLRKEWQSFFHALEQLAGVSNA